MITHLLTRIDLMMNSFSKGQKRIALYIEEHYDKAAFMTASKLGETVGVSESTVVRFATELGYDGYPRLQKAMQEMIRNKLTSVQRIEVTSSRIGNGNVLDSVLNQDIDKIRRTIEETSHEDFNRAVDEICNAKRIYIFGVRSTGAIAGFLAYYFELIFDNVVLINTTSATSTSISIRSCKPTTRNPSKTRTKTAPIDSCSSGVAKASAIPNASISPRSKISKTETTSFASPDSTVPRIVTP